MKRILLIVDPQNDFINGSLAVPEAEYKMRALGEYLKENDYEFIAVTLDSHPKNHCSFKENGGIWPKHCIKGTKGWKIPGYLYPILQNQLANYYFKGQDFTKEEYSIFPGNELLKQHILESNNYISIDICGIAGDYCVLETLKGLIKFVPKEKIRVLTQYVASIDNGEKLNNFIKENNICGA